MSKKISVKELKIANAEAGRRLITQELSLIAPILENVKNIVKSTEPVAGEDKRLFATAIRHLEQCSQFPVIIRRKRTPKEAPVSEEQVQASARKIITDMIEKGTDPIVFEEQGAPRGETKEEKIARVTRGKGIGIGADILRGVQLKKVVVPEQVIPEPFKEEEKIRKKPTHGMGFDVTKEELEERKKALKKVPETAPRHHKPTQEHKPMWDDFLKQRERILRKR